MNENRAVSKTELSVAGSATEQKADIQGNVPLADKHPNLTLLESGQNPGEILRAAREKAGLTLSDISAQTKINERQLSAIESGDVSRLPPETFAKAFIKSYCKALRIDAAPVILSFGFSEVSANTGSPARTSNGEMGRNEPIEPKMPSSSKRLSSLNFDRKTGKKSLGYGIALAALAVLAVFYIPVFVENQNAEITDPDAIDPVSQSVAPLDAQPAPEAGITSQQAPLAPVDSAIFPALQQPSGTAPTAAAPEAVAPVATPAAPVANATASPASTPVSPAPIAVAPTAPAAVPPVAEQPAGVLTFNFQEQSWVTVRDANDKVLVSQLNQAGSKLDIRGQGPFKLIVGNAKAVNVSSNGKPVDLSTSIKGEVARVTVQ